MLSCKETSRLLSESRERPLPQIAAIEAAARAFGRRAEESPPESLGSLSPEARERIETALRDEA